MADEGRYTGTSRESLEAAANEALQQVPEGPEGLRRATIVEQRLESGGFVGGTQYTVTVAAEPVGDGGGGYR
jgi:flavin-binding protein dodecin